METSIKTNFVFNLINTVAGLLFPLITFPYASRIMQADGIGLVNFFQSIIGYIILLSSIGIPLYSIREVARVRDDVKKMNITAVEIFLLHSLLTVFGYVGILVICLTVVEVQVDIPLFLVLSTSIFFTAIGCEWFYQGIEDFKYIAMRSLAIKILFVILLFVFVRSKSDLMVYGIITVMGTVGNNVFNFIRLRRHIHKKLFKFKELHPLRHLKPALKVFILNLIVSLYVNLNPVMLGFLSDVTSVGFFTAASKISNMLLGLTVALQNAVLPRTSNLLQSGNYEKFKDLTQKVLDFIFFLALPLSVLLVILSSSVICVLCGETYRPASLSLAILAPIIFVISLSGLFGIQMLYPQGKEKIVIVTTALGALTNLVLNFALIPVLSYDGASISTLIAEIVVTITMAFLGRKYLPLDKFNSHYKDCIIGTMIMSIFVYAISKLVDSDYIIVLLAPVVGCIVYMSWMLIKKNTFTTSLLNMLIENKILSLK